MDKATAQLFDLQGWIVYRTEHQQDSIHIYVGRPRKVARCPECGNVTSRIYDRARQWRRKLHTWCNEKPVYLGYAPVTFSVRVVRKFSLNAFPAFVLGRAEPSGLKPYCFSACKRAASARPLRKAG